MIKTDERGNLYILQDNSGYFTIKDLPKVNGSLEIVFDGDSRVEKKFDVSGQNDVIVKLSRQDVEDIGVGEHLWWGDLIHGDEKDTIIYNKICVLEREF